MSSIDKYIKKAEETKEVETELEPIEEDKEAPIKTKKKLKFKIPEKKKKEPEIIEEEETEPEEDIDLETKRNIIKKYMGETEYRQGRKLKRKEKKEFMNLEKENFKEKQNTVLILAIIGIFSIFFIYMYVKVEWALVIIIMYGIMVCLPIGMFLGFIVLDPWWRCKILRKTTKRNFGIVFFVSKAQKMVTKIKDFDAGLIWKKTQCWVLTKSAVYQLSKDGEQLVERGTIEPNKIISLVDTVPTLFVDLDSMEPLSLIGGNEPISPEEIGSSLKSWADNQLAKALFIRKSLDMYFIIVIIASIAAAGLAYYGTTKIDELSTKITALNNLVQNALQYLPPPT